MINKWLCAPLPIREHQTLAQSPLSLGNFERLYKLVNSKVGIKNILFLMFRGQDPSLLRAIHICLKDINVM